MPGPSAPLPLASRRLSTTALAWILAAASALSAVGPAAAASCPPARGERGMVVSPEALATRSGVGVLRRGGNAVDAAVAVAFSLAVTYPLAGNLGGGGFLLYRTPAGEYHALDFRETAPRALEAERFLDEDGRPVPGLSLEGGLAIGVPGSVHGLHRAHGTWGRLGWAELVEPAIRLAREGFEVSREMARTLARAEAKLGADAEARRIFFGTDGRPLAEGERLVQADLAATLERIARDGPDGFYVGPVAAAVARTVQARGGVMDERDLAGYRAALRTPVEGRYRGYRIVAFPPPSSGGVTLLQILGMLERFDLAALGPGSSATVHRMAEAERRAYADRSRWLGDPEFHDNPVDGLLAADYLRSRARSIRPRRATPSRRLAPGTPAPPPESGETLHLSVADTAGGTVALTTTLNAAYGTGIVAEGTGVLLNNEIDDFALAPGVANLYGLLGGEANAVAGGKRPLSSMSPTIVELPEGGPRPRLVLGSPGGSTIITSVAQVLVNVVDHGMAIEDAVAAPRFHHQWQPDRILHEPRAFARDVADALRARGHRLERSESSLGNVNAIATDIDGTWLGVADPRRAGLAEGH